MRIFLIVLLMFTSKIISQDLEWAKQIGGPISETANSLEIDSEGNTYILGTSTSPIFDLDPTDGIELIDNEDDPYGPSVTYLIKLDSNGNYVWGKNLGRFSIDLSSFSMKIGNDGHINILAMFADVYVSGGSVFRQNFKIIKLDVNGNLIFQKKFLNVVGQPFRGHRVSSLDVDLQNDIYITGCYKFGMTLEDTDPPVNLSSISGDSFLMKINGQDGNVIWARKFDISFMNEHFESVKVRLDGNLSLLLSNGDNQSFTEYGYNFYNINSQNGEIIWQKYFNNQSPQTLHNDKEGNSIISGHLNFNHNNDLTFDVDPSENVYNLPRTSKYLLWLDSDGNFLDVKSYTDANYVKFSSMENDSENNLYVAGEYNFQFDTDPSENSYILQPVCQISTIYRQGFSIKFDNARNFVDAFNLGKYTDCPNLYFTDIKVKNGNTYLTAQFSGTVDVDPSDGLHLFNTTLNGYDTDGTIIKLSPCASTKPSGNVDQYFCSAQNSQISNLNPNSPAIKWYDSLSSSVPLSANVSLINGHTYYATKTVEDCFETDRLSVMVHIIDSPSAPIFTPQTICASSYTTLRNLNVNGVNLKWYDSFNTLLQNSTIVENNAIYYVTQTIANCESEKTLVSLSINTTMPPTVSQNPFLCQNVTHTISDLVKLSDISITCQNIKWYDALIGGNILPLTTRLENGTTYYASQTISGCESARIAVSPTVQETTSPIGFAVQYFCDTETLTVQDLVVTGTDVVFYDDRYAGTILPFSTPLVDGVIYWASQTINGCKSYVRLPVLVNILNGIPANDYQTLICDELNDGQENIALSSYNSNLIANTNLYSFEYYTTFEGANMGNASDKINDFDTFRLTSGENTVYVKIVMNALCFKIVALKLTVISSPVLAMRDLFSLCENNNVTIYADPGYRYLWSNSATTPSITVGTPGNYWVTVFKDHGSVVCSTTKHFQIVISNKATIDNINVQDWTANDNTISVFVSGDGDYEYSLDGVNYQTSNQFNGLASGEYRVYVNDKNGCGLTWKDLFLLMHPKFFTPNNDGANDFWKIKFSSLEPGLSVKIFDRYGKFIKELFHNDAGWDGTHNGQPLPATDYWFVVKRANGTEHRGHFSLKR